MQVGQKYIDDGNDTIDGVALPAMVGSAYQISDSKELMKENATLIKEVKAIKEKGVDPKQALLDSKWTKALREGTTVSFYLESEENKKFVDDNPFRYQIVLDEAKVTGQLSKVDGGGDVNIQNRMKVEVENHYLMANLTTLKSIGADKSPTGMLNNREVMMLGSSSKNSIADALQAAMLLARNFTLKRRNFNDVQLTSVGMNVVYIDTAEPSEKYNFQLMWDLTKDQNGLFKLVIVLENRPA
jgi:hypothetical protein